MGFIAPLFATGTAAMATMAGIGAAASIYQGIEGSKQAEEAAAQQQRMYNDQKSAMDKQATIDAIPSITTDSQKNASVDNMRKQSKKFNFGNTDLSKGLVKPSLSSMTTGLLTNKSTTLGGG